MKSKLLIFSILLSSFSFISFGQSGIYLVTLSHSVSDASECIVIVTDPQGGTTSTNITHYLVNVQTHYSELNTIFNNVITNGYQLFGQLCDPFVDGLINRMRTTWVFKAP